MKHNKAYSMKNPSNAYHAGANTRIAPTQQFLDQPFSNLNQQRLLNNTVQYSGSSNIMGPGSGMYPGAPYTPLNFHAQAAPQTSLSVTPGSYVLPTHHTQT